MSNWFAKTGVALATALLTALFAVGPGASAAAADDSDAVGTQFSSGGNTYTIRTLASESEAGTVQLSGVDRTAASLVIPERVTSPASGTSYTVSRVNFAAFNNDTALVTASLPSSVTALLSGANGAFFYGCSSLESVRVTGSNDNSLLASDDGVLYAVNDGKKATLLAYPSQKDNANFTVPEDVSTIAPCAFAHNEHLEKVTFQAGLAGEADQSASNTFRGGICASSFEGCSSLESVSFPEGATIGTVLTSSSPAIGASAFKDCTSLKSLVIPALVTADQKGTAYQTFAELNPGSNLASGTSETFTSGYAAYWHNSNGPVARAGMGDGALEGCTALESVTFEAGNSTGALAYWVGSGNVFTGCTALKSLVYESAQAYWGNPNTSMRNGAFTDIWSSDYNNITAPTYYYAVDYYATKDDAEAADASGSARLARVEYERGTSTAAIATSAASLAGQTAERSLYATTGADGIVPDPDEAAASAGLSGTGWVWRLDGTQARRESLTESCKAYLTKADDLSNGRIGSSQTTALYRQADRNLSQSTALCPESPFDVARYYGDDNYSMTPLSGETSPYFTYDPTTGELDTGFAVYAADGTELSSSAYRTAWQRYDSDSGTLEDVSGITSGGAYLVTITPADSAYEGTLSEWVLVQARDGYLVEAYGSSPTTTEDAAKYPYSQVTSLDYSDAPYSVTIGANDVCGALVASSCAGLVRGGISIDTEQTAKRFGFLLNRSTYPNGKVQDSSQTLTFARTGLSAPDYAVAVYGRFADEGNRRTYGMSSEDAVWGDTALLVPLGHVNELASACAYAYATKAPVFFTELDGSCSQNTLTALGNFSRVKVVGSTAVLSDEAFAAIQSALGEETSLERLGGSAENPGALSLAIAAELAEDGKAAYTTATVSDTSDPMDCILALNFTGHESGVTLVSASTAQSEEIMERLHEVSDTLTLVKLFGRSEGNATVVSSSSYGQGNAFSAIWDSDSDFQGVLGSVSTTVEDAGFSAEATDPDAGEPTTDNKDDSKETDDTEKKSSTGKKKNTKASTGKAKKNHASTSGRSSATNSGESGNTGSSSSSSEPDRYTPRTVPSTSGNAGGDTGSAAKSSGHKNLNPTKANATTAPTAQQASATANADESDATDIPSSDTTPLWQKLLFIVLLLALCAALVPILRKCR